MHVSSSSSVLISSSLQWRTPSQHLSFTHFPVQFACASTSTSYARDRSKNEVVSRHPICLSHNLSLPTPFSSSSFLLQTNPARPFLNGHGSRRRKNSKLRIVSAVFERFTERAIKAVIFSQREAKALGRDMVFTQHLLLGLIAEEEQHRHLHPNSLGFLGSGITMDQARRAVRSIWRLNSQSQSQTAAESDPRAASGSGSASDLSFSISTKRVLEAALEYSRSRAHNFIAPEHIVIGLLTADDGSAGQVLKR